MKLNTIMLIIAMSASTSWATPLETAGEEIYQQRCFSCHNSTVSVIPTLFGLRAEYLESSLIGFKESGRDDEIMFQIAETLSETDISELVGYMVDQDPCDLPAEVEAAEGDPEIGKLAAASCFSCHGSEGQGGSGPVLSGQRNLYLVETIKKFRNEIRTNSHPMNETTREMTDQNILDISAYFSSTRVCPVREK